MIFFKVSQQILAIDFSAGLVQMMPITMWRLWKMVRNCWRSNSSCFSLINRLFILEGEQTDEFKQRTELHFLSYENGGKDILVKICRDIALQNTQQTNSPIRGINKNLIEKYILGNKSFDVVGILNFWNTKMLANPERDIQQDILINVFLSRKYL